MKKSLYNIFLASLAISCAIEAQAGKFGEQLPANQTAQNLQNRMRKIQEKLSTPAQSQKQTPSIQAQKQNNPETNQNFVLENKQQAQKKESSTQPPVFQQQKQQQILKKLDAVSVPMPNALDHPERLFSADATSMEDAVNQFDATLATGFHSVDADGARVEDKLNALIGEISSDGLSIQSGLNAVDVAINGSVTNTVSQYDRITDLNKKLSPTATTLNNGISQIGSLVSAGLTPLPLPDKNLKANIVSLIEEISDTQTSSANAAVNQVSNVLKGSALASNENIKNVISGRITEIDKLPANKSAKIDNILSPASSATLKDALERMSFPEMSSQGTTFQQQVDNVGKWIDDNTQSAPLNNRLNSYSQFAIGVSPIRASFRNLLTYITEVAVFPADSDESTSTRSMAEDLFGYLAQRIAGYGTVAQSLNEAYTVVSAKIGDGLNEAIQSRILHCTRKLIGSPGDQLIDCLTAGEPLILAIKNADALPLYSVCDQLDEAKLQFFSAKCASSTTGTVSFTDGAEYLNDLVNPNSNSFYAGVTSLQSVLDLSSIMSIGLDSQETIMGTVAELNSCIKRINKWLLNTGEAEWPLLSTSSCITYSIEDLAKLNLKIMKRMCETQVLQVAKNASTVVYNPIPSTEMTNLNSLDVMINKIFDYTGRS